MLARLSAFRNDRAACRDHAAAFEQANDMLERMEWPALVSKFDQKASYIKGQRAKAAVLKSAICGAGP